MIINQASKVRTSDPSAFAWAGLRKFQNVENVAKTLEAIHKVPAKHKDVVRKQAQQIRYCLIQAREYFAAAEAVTTATKPNLLYYGTMSLALAEILFKQSGESSLDRARQQHRHHGLTMTVGGTRKSATISESAGLIRAHPVEQGGIRKGTFELWRKTSREHPLPGLATRFWPDGGSTSSFEVLYGAVAFEYPPLPTNGLSLSECLANIPLLVEHTSRAGLPSPFVRGKCEARIWPVEQWRTEYVVLFHPNPLVQRLIETIRINPNVVDRMTIVQVNQGIHIMMESDWINGVVGMPMPPAATINTEEWRMWVETPALNEFGFIYVALYLAGNYARYFPDKWLADVESSNPLSLAIEELCSVAEWRAPWLALCELDQTLYVNEA